MRGLLLVVIIGACASTKSARPASKQPDDEPPPPISVATETIQEDVELQVIHQFPGVDFLRSDNHAAHDHGGPPAAINNVVLQFDVRDRRAHEVEIKHVDYLRRGCKENQWRERRAMKIVRHDLYGKAFLATGDASVTIPPGVPGRYFVRVELAHVVEAYQSCDVFAFDVDLIVDRVRAKFTVPLFVTREEPIE